MNIDDLEHACNLLVHCGCMTETMADEVNSRIRQIGVAAALAQPQPAAAEEDDDPEITG